MTISTVDRIRLVAELRKKVDEVPNAAPLAKVGIARRMMDIIAMLEGKQEQPKVKQTVIIRPVVEATSTPQQEQPEDPMALQLASEEELERAGFTEEAYAGTRGDPASRVYGWGETMPFGLTNYFGGIFASEDRDTAKSHGPTIQAFRYKPEVLLRDRTLKDKLFYSDESDQWLRTLRSIVGGIPTDEELDDLADYVAMRKDVYSDEFVTGNERLGEILGYSDLGEMSWGIQGIRGELARRMGYSVVEMPDEHGISLLILSGKGVRRVEQREEPAPEPKRPSQPPPQPKAPQQSSGRPRPRMSPEQEAELRRRMEDSSSSLLDRWRHRN